MAEAEEVEDRGVEIADRHFVFRGVEAEVVGGAIRHPAAHPPTCEPD